jgi:hypothetical protein
MGQHATADGSRVTEEIKKERIPRAMLAGPASVTSEATIAEMDRQGNFTVLRPGTNDWVCIPGDQNVVGWPDMAIDPMGMVWFKDLLARKPKPTNTSPGLIYMLNGATQRSYTDPFDSAEEHAELGRETALTSASLQMKNELTSVAQYAVGQGPIMR